MRKSEYPDAISMDFTFYCEQVQLDFVAIVIEDKLLYILYIFSIVFLLFW